MHRWTFRVSSESRVPHVGRDRCTRGDVPLVGLGSEGRPFVDKSCLGNVLVRSGPFREDRQSPASLRGFRGKGLWWNFRPGRLFRWTLDDVAQTGRVFGESRVVGATSDVVLPFSLVHTRTDKEGLLTYLTGRKNTFLVPPCSPLVADGVCVEKFV